MATLGGITGATFAVVGLGGPTYGLEDGGDIVFFCVSEEGYDAFMFVAGIAAEVAEIESLEFP